MMMKEKLDRIIQERKQQQNNNPLIFWEHINILKKYLFIICFFVILFSSIAFFYNAQILKFLTKPLNGIDLIFLSPIDPITFIMKMDLLAGVILSAPIILYLVWRFVSPALMDKQKKILKRIFIFSFILTILSVIYAYFYLIRISLDFLLSINTEGIIKSFTAQNYLNFIIFETFLTIFIFQVPLIIILLIYFGICKSQTISSKRRYIYLFSIIILSVITPTTDIISLLILLIPTGLLFEIGLLIARLIPPRGNI